MVLGELVEQEDLGLSLLSGEGALGREIAGAHSIDVEDPTRFLEPPLYTTEYSRGFGTLYTAVYTPASRHVRYRWPDTTWEHSLAAFTPSARTVRLRERADRHVGAGPG